MTRDEEILKQIQKNEEKGMTMLFKRYYKPLVVFAETYTRDLTEAEDIVQEQFIKLWSKDVFNNLVAEALSTFLFTVTKNACLNLLEKKKIKTHSLDKIHLQLAFSEAQKLEDKTVEIIHSAINKLPEKTKDVIINVMLNDMSYQDAADYSGVSINTIKTLLKHGLKTLRELLGDKQYLLFIIMILDKDKQTSPNQSN